LAALAHWDDHSGASAIAPAVIDLAAVDPVAVDPALSSCHLID